MSVWDQIVAAHSKPITQTVRAAPKIERLCKACQQVKPIADFYPRRTRGENAVTSKCKPCHIAYSRALRQRGSST